MKKVFLCILDGWGISDKDEHNAICYAKEWQKLLNKYPHSQLQASENYVGLPSGQMGNSEVGHTTIGLGRVLLQDLPKIDKMLLDNSFENNMQLLAVVDKLKSTNKAMHIMGLLSPGGVHSHMDHIIGLARIVANQGVKVHIHAFMDGRDTPPKSGADYMQKTFDALEDFTNITISTVAGRYYAMDRDNRWDRIESAYNALTKGINCCDKVFTNPVEYILQSYDNTTTDEFIKPGVHENYQGMDNGDALWMVNFRSDRVRQLLSALLLPDFKSFQRQTINFSACLAMNEYADFLKPYLTNLNEKVDVEKSIGEVVSEAGLKQYRISETEKYAHVTFFLNGGQEKAFDGEERILVPSPQVATYDLQPEMNAKLVEGAILKAMDDRQASLIVANFANSDMVGHTGNETAAIKAVEAIDTILKNLEKKALETDWLTIVTADHGNAECMVDENNQPHTAHTLNPVPFLLISKQKEYHVKNGTLADIAPTILTLLGLKPPKEMTGQNIITT